MDGKKLLFPFEFTKGRWGLWTCDTPTGAHLTTLLKDEHCHISMAVGRLIVNRLPMSMTFCKAPTASYKSMWCLAEGGNPGSVLIPNNAFEESPRFSPDGKQSLAFVSTRDGNQEIYVALGSNITRLTSEIAFADYSPCWSPDGKKIAFTVLPVTATRRFAAWMPTDATSAG